MKQKTSILSHQISRSQCIHRLQPRLNLHLSPAFSGELIQFKLSDIGEGIREVTVKEWHIKVGDHVNQFDSICEVQSDKASVTITSRYDGVIRRLYHDVDAMALVGQPLIDIELDNNRQQEDTDSSSDSEGDILDAGEKLKEKTNHASTSPAAVAQENIAPVVETSSMSDVTVLTTPAVRKIAKENNIDLRLVKGTGKDARILKEDLLLFLQQQQVPKTPKPSAKEEPQPSVIPTPIASFVSKTVVSSSPDDRIVPLNAIQKAMRKTMIAANNIPHLTLSDEISISELVRYRSRFHDQGIKVSYMPFFIKAASLALKEFPMLNAYTDENCETLVYKGSHNIGFAMDTPQGLVVPNIKSVEHKSILQIADELRHLMDLGNRGKLSQPDLSHGTFTLSNIGSIGGTYTRPVILPPQVIIGGIGKMMRVPKFVNPHSDAVIGSHIVHVSWSADHRVIDGATVARFSNRWKMFLEHPEQIILHTA